MTIAGKRTTDPVLRRGQGVRVVLGPRRCGGYRPGRQAGPRSRRPPAAHPGLGSRHYPTVDKVQARLAAIAKQRRVTGLLRTQVGTDQVTGKPTLAWWFDPDALAAEQATDGWYALLTNLDPTQADAAEVLARSKGQEVVERRYGASKGPLAVAPSSCSPTGASRRWSP